MCGACPCLSYYSHDVQLVRRVHSAPFASTLFRCTATERRTGCAALDNPAKSPQPAAAARPCPELWCVCARAHWQTRCAVVVCTSFSRPRCHAHARHSMRACAGLTAGELPLMPGACEHAALQAAADASSMQLRSTAARCARASKRQLLVFAGMRHSGCGAGSGPRHSA